MKRVLLFTLLISFIGYSQNTIQTNHPSFNDGLPQDLVEKMNPMSLELRNDKMMDLNPIQRFSGMKPQSLQSEMIVQSDNNITYRLDEFTEIYFESSLNQKQTIQFDENENIILLISYNWDTTTQSFVPSMKLEWTYDGNSSLRIQYNWSSESQSFVPLLKNEYTYDDNGNLTLLMIYNWSSESQSFVLDYKTEFYFNDNGNLNPEIRYTWDITTQSFIPSWKNEYTYDENGNRTLLIGYNWDTTTQSFVPNYKNENSYDENGNQTSFIFSNWSSETQSYVQSVKHEYTYDNNNFLTIKTTYKWYSDLGVFKPTFKMNITTSSETETNLVREGIISEYDTNFNTWSELEGEEFKSHWYYTKTPSLSTNSVESNSFSIYPNPTSNTLQINSSESLSNPIFELYDVKGSKILSNPFKLTEPIDVSDLQPSMYIYNVKDGSEVKQSGKVLIE